MACICYPVHGYCSPKTPSSCSLLVRGEGSCASNPPERRSLCPCCRFVARTCSFTTPTRCTMGESYTRVIIWSWWCLPSIDGKCMREVPYQLHSVFEHLTFVVSFICFGVLFIFHITWYFKLVLSVKKNTIWKKGGERVVDITDCVMDWTVRGSIVGRDKICLFSPKLPHRCGAHPSPPHPIGKAAKAWSLQLIFN